MPHAPFIRLPRYSLCTALLVTTAVVVWLGYNAHLVGQRRMLLAESGWYSFYLPADQPPGIP